MRIYSGVLRDLLWCAVLWCMVLLLSSCSIPPNPLLNTAIHLFPEHWFQNKKPVLTAGYSFIRLERHHESGFAALGYRLRFAADSHRFEVLPNSAVVNASDWHRIREIWYTASAATLMLCNGRLCGTSGSHLEWRDVDQDTSPAWKILLTQPQPVRWQRTRLVMPGYQQVRDVIETRSANNRSPKHLLGRSAASLRWFEDHLLQSQEGLPDTLLGVDPQQEKVVYSETCISPDYCFSWQYWPNQPTLGHS